MERLTTWGLVAVLGVWALVATCVAVSEAHSQPAQSQLPSYCQSYQALEAWQQAHPDLMTYCPRLGSG